MEHDILALMDHLEFARENFGHTTDPLVKHRFNTVIKTCLTGGEYQEEVAVFDQVTITRIVKDLSLRISVTGLDNDVRQQQYEIERVRSLYY